MKTKEQRAREAKERNEAWAKMSPEQQLAELDRRGVTAKKQRAKIQKRITA